MFKYFIYLVALITLSSCAFDHRKDVAYELLYQFDGFENDVVYTAAISARFPFGTNEDEIRKFSASVDGDCFNTSDVELVCEIPVRGYICAVRLIQIKAQVKNGVIQSTSFFSGGLSC